MKSLGELIRDLRTCEIATASFDSPLLRLEFVLEFVRDCISSDLAIDYVDYDLTFSSLLHNISPPETFLQKIHITQPEESSPERSLISALTSLEKSEGFLVLDSLNMMQNLLALKSPSPDLAIANHRSSILVSLSQQIARERLRTVLVLSLEKLRPRRTGGESIVWEKEIVGGRMMKLKNDIILLVKRSIPEAKSLAKAQSLAREMVVSSLEGGQQYSIVPRDW
ncbi:MAG: hypothetical protein M1587_06135 [Thaumarchaeota archaeon]|nr:hypothetical protein [Nitrososphaerota archaeon]